VRSCLHPVSQLKSPSWQPASVRRAIIIGRLLDRRFLCLSPSLSLGTFSRADRLERDPCPPGGSRMPRDPRNHGSMSKEAPGRSGSRFAITIGLSCDSSQRRACSRSTRREIVLAPASRLSGMRPTSRAHWNLITYS